MPTEFPDFDPNGHGQSAILYEGVCHAERTAYDEDGEEYTSTDCSVYLPDRPFFDPDVEMGARIDFVESDEEMCRECWPESIFEGEDE